MIPKPNRKNDSGIEYLILWDQNMVQYTYLVNRHSSIFVLT